MSDEKVPAELSYTAEHEWVQRSGETTVRVGITDYAQAQLGDVVFVQLPEVGAVAAPGGAMGEVESTKSVSDVFAPLAGTVSAVNSGLDADPELVNSDPYGAGWLVEIEAPDAASLDAALAAMLDAQGYEALTAGEH
ncbi:glycine cleavage system protein GcvH [Rhodococcus antarcticus]|uniref:Glycine cleavage system H protein n=1 Tax=Rhodococcus antarcticus TaxID=2987751 RepID=A0ABY6P411_9NOCA|nr:glycine cleavage system protein GcvH [Rhodococcus antarcticus]UZJ26400.1 glycine cleavage system protein GcvH [Rhodococcus antarcticus]